MTETAMQLLLIEDNPGDVGLLKEALRDAGQLKFNLVCGETLRQGMEQARRQAFDVLLLDLTLPDSHGLDTVRSAHEQCPNLPIVVLTCADDEVVGMEAVRSGAQEYMVKGQATGRMLVRAIRYAMERQKVEALLRQARDELELRVQERTAELEHTLTALQSEFDDRIRTEMERQENEQRFQQFAEAVPEVFWIATADLGRVLFVNSAYQKIWGRPVASLLQAPKSFLDTVHEDDRTRVKAVIIELAQKASSGAMDPIETDFRIVRPDGAIVHIHGRSFAIRDERGQAKRLCGTAEDVTAWRMAQEEWHRLADIVQNSSEAIMSVGADWKIKTWNPAAEKLYGYTAQEAIGQHLSMLIPPDRRSEMDRQLACIARHEPIKNYRTVRLRKDNQPIDVFITVSVIYDANGKLDAMSAIIREADA